MNLSICWAKKLAQQLGHYGLANEAMSLLGIPRGAKSCLLTPTPEC